MKWGPVQKVGGLCIAFLAACSDGGSSTTPDGNGGATGTAGTSAAAGTSGGAGTSGDAGTSGGAGTTGRGGVQGRGGTVGTGGGAGGVQGRGGTVGTGGGAGTTAALSFAADIWPVISQTRNPPFDYRGQGLYSGCTAASPCHGSGPAGASLAMTSSSGAYSALVNVASRTSLCTSAGATMRVIPGNPDGSCLVAFYIGRLKDDLKWVNQAEIDLVRRWIAEGARP